MARSGEAQFHALRIGTSTTVGHYLMPRLLGETLPRQFGIVGHMRVRVIDVSNPLPCATAPPMMRKGL